MGKREESVSVELPESAWSPSAAPGSFDSRARFTRTSLRKTEGEGIAEIADIARDRKSNFHHGVNHPSKPKSGSPGTPGTETRRKPLKHGRKEGGEA